LELFATWLEASPEVPHGRWFKRFPEMTVCGEGELIKTFLTANQAPTGSRAPLSPARSGCTLSCSANRTQRKICRIVYAQDLVGSFSAHSGHANLWHSLSRQMDHGQQPDRSPGATRLLGLGPGRKGAAVKVAIARWLQEETTMPLK
jgi:hypothetical protein